MTCSTTFLDLQARPPYSGNGQEATAILERDGPQRRLEQAPGPLERWSLDAHQDGLHESFLMTPLACLCRVLIGTHSPVECRMTGADVDLRSLIGLPPWNVWIHIT